VSAGALTKRLKCLPVLAVRFELVLFMFWSSLAECSALAQRADRLVRNMFFFGLVGTLHAEGSNVL
jgi:hypothetical protein